MFETRTVRVRDIATKGHFDLPGRTVMLRVPYDMFKLQGPAVYTEGKVLYQQDGNQLVGRVNPGHLGDASPGERVLVADEALHKEEAGWWLCEVELVDGEDWP